MDLKGAQLLRSRGIGWPAQESGQFLDGADILALRIGREVAHRHVVQHATAQRTDGLG
jgi:hypothetical protein